MLQIQPSLADLYHEDETAWLDAMSELLRLGSYSALDHEHLQEFLEDMAKSERREVTSRILILLMHILKWEYKPEMRSRSWKLSILHQGFELREHVGKGVLRRHADDVLDQTYQQAVKMAMTETGKFRADFPIQCPFSFDEILAYNPEGDLPAA